MHTYRPFIWKAQCLAKHSLDVCDCSPMGAYHLYDREKHSLWHWRGRGNRASLRQTLHVIRVCWKIVVRYIRPSPAHVSWCFQKHIDPQWTSSYFSGCNADYFLREFATAITPLRMHQRYIVANAPHVSTRTWLTHWKSSYSVFGIVLAKVFLTSLFTTLFLH